MQQRNARSDFVCNVSICKLMDHAGHAPPNVEQQFRPDDQMREEYCENEARMGTCPRWYQYLNYLKESHDKKKKAKT